MIIQEMTNPVNINDHREFVVGIGTLALLNAGLAQTKRRSGLAWFFLSLLLGPIATLLLVSAFRHPPEGRENGGT